MNINLIHLGIAALAVTTLQAQPGGGPRGGGPGGPRGGQEMQPPSIIGVLDTDKDRTISSDEIAVSAETLLTLDTNGDGALAAEELVPARPDGQGGGERQGPPGGGDRQAPPKGGDPAVKALDTDGDGTLSADEIAAAPTNLLKLDSNGDGALSPEDKKAR